MTTLPDLECDAFRLRQGGFNLKAESAAQTFGGTKAEIEKLVLETDRTPLDFYAFFWEYLLDERESIDLKKEWKAWGTPPR